MAKTLLSAAEVSSRCFSSRTEKSFWNEIHQVLWRFEHFLKRHKVWNRHGNSIRFYRGGNLYNAYVRAGDVAPELAPVEPAEESWTRMKVDDGGHDEQDEADQNEELRRVLAARWPTELERQKHFRQIVLCSHLGAKCVCVCERKRNKSTTQETGQSRN